MRMDGATPRGDGPWHDTWAGGTAFPPIGDYAFLSDCETGALVAPGGNVEWLCLPRFDAASVFGAILDRNAGGFRFGPADVSVPAAPHELGAATLPTVYVAFAERVHLDDVVEEACGGAEGRLVVVIGRLEVRNDLVCHRSRS